jgi:hypothetical protein
MLILPSHLYPDLREVSSLQALHTKIPVGIYVPMSAERPASLAFLENESSNSTEILQRQKTTEMYIRLTVNPDIQRYHLALQQTAHVVVEWLTRLLRIPEVPGTNLGPDILTEVFVVFLSPSKRMLG